jgi:hypothetical protein
MYAEFYLENLIGRDHLGSLLADARIPVINWALNGAWLRNWINVAQVRILGGLLWTRQWMLRVHKRGQATLDHANDCHFWTALLRGVLFVVSLYFRLSGVDAWIACGPVDSTLGPTYWSALCLAVSSKGPCQERTGSPLDAVTCTTVDSVLFTTHVCLTYRSFQGSLHVRLFPALLVTLASDVT